MSQRKTFLGSSGTIKLHNNFLLKNCRQFSYYLIFEAELLTNYKLEVIIRAQAQATTVHSQGRCTSSGCSQ